MSTIIPKERPKLGAADAIALALSKLSSPGCNEDAIRAACPTLLLGVRGYYADSYKRPRVNDVGVYDDAMFLVTPDRVLAFNANVDPSRTGWNPSIEKYYAQLEVGVWPFRRGPHKGVSGHFRQMTTEEAQAAELSRYFSDSRMHGSFTVRRAHQDDPSAADSHQTGYFAINIHEGTHHGTSSWGCQTLPPEQFAEMRDLAYAAMDATGQRWLPYVLVDKL